MRDRSTTALTVRCTRAPAGGPAAAQRVWHQAPPHLGHPFPHRHPKRSSGSYPPRPGRCEAIRTATTAAIVAITTIAITFTATIIVATAARPRPLPFA